MDLPSPVFIDTDLPTITSEMIAMYESLTNKTLQPGQPERLLINAFAYREFLIRTSIQKACLQNLVRFSTFPNLDYLAELLGLERLEATKARCKITFDLVSGHGSVVLPKGTRVSTVDGKYIFEVDEPVIIAPTDIDAEADCSCQQAGVGANDYLPGSVSVILDPLAFVSSAMNTITTAGGADQETDDHLRTRFKAAAERFSTAGSRAGYKYYALSANPSIIDVSVVSLLPGEVSIYPLVSGSITTPQQILDEVALACNDDKVRPLTDSVIVISPSPVNYEIQVDLTLFNDVDEALVNTTVQAAVNEFSSDKARRMGRDVVREAVASLCMIKDKVYKANVIEPAVDVIVNESSFANCIGISVNIVAFTNG
jgi:phage-related baseplate assembly protein